MLAGMAHVDAADPGAIGDPTPAPPALIAQAEAAAARFPQCFWFWHPDARIRSIEDVRLVVRHLRDYGDHDAWLAARDLTRCLSPHSRRTSSRSSPPTAPRSAISPAAAC
jgi:hypothetical protein